MEARLALKIKRNTTPLFACLAHEPLPYFSTRELNNISHALNNFTSGTLQNSLKIMLIEIKGLAETSDKVMGGMSHRVKQMVKGRWSWGS